MIQYKLNLVSSDFEWDAAKDIENRLKHGVSFSEAQLVFADSCRVIQEDLDHSDQKETRYFCYGQLNEEVLAVRFTYRGDKIRIFGAGYWRKGRKIYEEKNRLH